MAEELNEQLLSPDADVNAPPRIAMGAQGYPGLKVESQQIQQEAVQKLRMPYLIKEIDEMKRDSAIASALTFYKMMMARVDWDVKVPVGASNETIERAKFIKSCMHDMDSSWFDFIQSTLSSIDYGFSISEMVFKRRTKNNSKYDDGLVGLKDLAPRAQQTHKEWDYSEDGRLLKGWYQSTSNLPVGSRYSQLQGKEKIYIPRDKFLLFRTSPENGNPEGAASLKSAWIAWRYKKAIEEEEMKGIARDLGGLLVMQIPARYMSPDAGAAEAAVYSSTQTYGRNVANGEQSCLILPSDVDPETKQKLFSVDLMTSQGSRGYDTNKILQRYQSQMLVALFADLLQMGADGGGSFALSDNKKDLVEYAIEFRLKEIANVLNKELIPALFKMNQWDQKELPYFAPSKTTEESLENYSKYIQRVCSVSAIEMDREFYNKTRSIMGLSHFDEDEPIHEDEIPNAVSRAGDGMETGKTGNGTSDNVAGTDNSANNLDNNA